MALVVDGLYVDRHDAGDVAQGDVDEFHKYVGELGARDVGVSVVEFGTEGVGYLHDAAVVVDGEAAVGELADVGHRRQICGEGACEVVEFGVFLGECLGAAFLLDGSCPLAPEEAHEP